MSLEANLVSAYKTNLGDPYYRYIIEEAYDGGRIQVNEKDPQSVFAALLRVQKTSFSRLGIEAKPLLPEKLSLESIPIFIEREQRIRYENFSRCLYNLGVNYDEEIATYDGLKAAFMSQNYGDFLTFPRWRIPEVTEIDPVIASAVKVTELNISESKLYRIPDEICLHDELKIIWGTERQKRTENPLSKAVFNVVEEEHISYNAAFQAQGQRMNELD